MVWTDSQDYGADEILYTIGTVLFNINNRLMREITILFEVYPRLFLFLEAAKTKTKHQIAVSLLKTKDVLMFLLLYAQKQKILYQNDT